MKDHMERAVSLSAPAAAVHEGGKVNEKKCLSSPQNHRKEKSLFQALSFGCLVYHPIIFSSKVPDSQ